jgi:hypothetical protein
MISERTLRQWRREALNSTYTVDCALNPNPDTIMSLRHAQEKDERILRLTQELMDLHLINKGV